MNSRIMLIAKKEERMIIMGRLIGIWISGLDLLRFEDFAFFAIKKIRIPVVPPEMTPPIPRMKMNPIM